MRRQRRVQLYISEVSLSSMKNNIKELINNPVTFLKKLNLKKFMISPLLLRSGVSLKM